MPALFTDIKVDSRAREEPFPQGLSFVRHLRQQETSRQSSSGSDAVQCNVLGKGLCSYLADVSSGHAKYYGRVVGIRKVARVDWWQVSIGVLIQSFRP